MREQPGRTGPCATFGSGLRSVRGTKVYRTVPHTSMVERHAPAISSFNGKKLLAELYLA
jgi:hypothetical protein